MGNILFKVLKKFRSHTIDIVEVYGLLGEDLKFPAVDRYKAVQKMDIIGNRLNLIIIC
ncbi:hypothetical protein Lepto7376_0991 [[Leptolyngbya] sp. PCC 7376]|nr:hypothetical protein Lepto7376_0991 [[Leptolyngbya] sp. PCC 7376]